MTDRPYHVMLVEDSTTQAISLTALLEGEGWKVTWVTSAERAFSALREFRPDLILLDYHLPGVRGDEVCRRIRMNVDTRRLPVVMLTSQEAQEVQVLDSGADDFVSKFTPAEVLMLRLRTLLQKAGPTERMITNDNSAFKDVHLLAVDDSPSFLERLRRELVPEGYKLDMSTEPAEALKWLAERRYDGIIIDLIMPKMDGFEVCRKVNEMRLRTQQPLISILLTGAESTENLSKALDAGADDFVGKSNDFSVLKGRIRALLRRKFYAEENNRIINELRMKELEALQERAAKEAAEARAALVEELQARTEELNQSREELSRANAAKDQFLAMLSHELRTPLTPVLAVVEERSEDQTLHEDIRRDFAMIRRNIRLETHLINDLLDLTRITQGKLEVSHDPVDLKKIIPEVVEMCTANLRDQAPIHIRIQDPLDATVTGDAVRLSQVVWNLLQNAAKFTPPEGSIELSLREGNTLHGAPCLILEVADTGVGIAPEMLERIFDAFQQENRPSTRLFGGLGLGLAISRAIVQLHHGRLSASSAGAGQGSTFRLELPHSQAISSTQPGISSAPAGEDTPPPPRSLHVLLVEDHADTRETLARMLRRRGHHVLLANGVREAADVAGTEPHLDVLISDFGLPDGSGLEVLQIIKPLHPVHAIILSGFGMEEDVEKSRAAGFAHHLTKPVEFARLEAVLQPGGTA